LSKQSELAFMKKLLHAAISDHGRITDERDAARRGWRDEKGRRLRMIKHMAVVVQTEMDSREGLCTYWLQAMEYMTHDARGSICHNKGLYHVCYAVTRDNHKTELGFATHKVFGNTTAALKWIKKRCQHEQKKWHRLLILPTPRVHFNGIEP